jgi:Pectate lyase superfamily protein/SMP-30/Gluconolactonase/LRE-like region
VKHSRFENVSGPALIISNENNPRTEINLQEILCKNVPEFALFRDSGKKAAGPGEIYRVQAFSHGLTIADLDAPAKIETSFNAAPLNAMPAAGSPVIRNLPPQDTWVNLHTVGAKGDGVTDDTAAIQRAIDEHATIYIPSGHYIVSDTLTLKPNTVLIGLHPSTTQFILPDSTPGFQGVGNVKPLLETPQGGTNIVTGIGIYTNGINNRASGVMWMAGEKSLMDDVRFLGGHGTNLADGTRVNPYNNTHTADPDLHRRWDAQYPSLWITNGGGGTFADIWTPDTYAQAGMLISNTATPGHVYELSSEHHVRNEIVLRHVSNWEIDSLQTEEEWGEGAFALPLEIDDSSNITIANFHSYRVIASYQPFPYAVRVARSSEIEFKNLHVNSNSKVAFDNSVFDQSYDVQVRYNELASLSISGKKPEPQRLAPAPVLAEGAKLEKLCGGFFTISGAAADAEGNLYFVDTHWQRIYRWTPETRDLKILRDNSLQPTQVAVDRAGNLIVISYAEKGTVYTFRPEALDDQITFIPPVAAAPRAGMTAALPVNYWGSHDFEPRVTMPRPYQFISPDGTMFIPAGTDFIAGATDWGVKMADVLRAFSLAKAVPGRPFYVSEESEQKTYSGNVGADGTLLNLKLFTEQGGESVIQDSRGNVYLAAGNIFIFDPGGKEIGTIEVPERPIDLIFGGKDGKTLFILTHSSLYAIQTRF